MKTKTRYDRENKQNYETSQNKNDASRHIEVNSEMAESRILVFLELYESTVLIIWVGLTHRRNPSCTIFYKNNTLAFSTCLHIYMFYFYTKIEFSISHYSISYRKSTPPSMPTLELSHQTSYLSSASRQFKSFQVIDLCLLLFSQALSNNVRNKAIYAKYWKWCLSYGMQNFAFICHYISLYNNHNLMNRHSITFFKVKYYSNLTPRNFLNILPLRIGLFFQKFATEFYIIQHIITTW